MLLINCLSTEAEIVFWASGSNNLSPKENVSLFSRFVSLSLSVSLFIFLSFSLSLFFSFSLSLFEAEEGKATSAQETDLARTMHSRLRHIASRHDEILEDLDRTVKLAAGKHGGLGLDDEENVGEHGTGLEQE